MKKTAIFLIIISVIINIFALNTSASEEGLCWFIRRAGNKQPQISFEHKIIEKYNGYYIDKKCSDESSNKKIYLTFDAGYDNGNVAKTLDILKEKNVSAAFFILDHIIYKNTDVVLRMADEGHLVCNHTKNHKDLSKLTKDEIEKNLYGLERAYEDKTGNKMSKYFRFPEGKYSEEALSVVNDMGYKTIFWSFGYDDWDNERQPDPNKSIEKIISNTHNGEVILLHPTSDTNVKILAQLIDKWREMGYSFGTLDELVMNM